MARILITGMSGAGKSTLLEELALRGHLTVDTDAGAWKLSDELWDEGRVARLLEENENIVVCGTVENQGKFYDRFDHIVLLSAPVEVLIDRLKDRTNNSYGKSAAEQLDVRRYVIEVEPLLRSGATLELDGRLPSAELADLVEMLFR